MGVMNEDRLTLYDGLIKTHITNTTVAKETGKGLSTNDYTTTEKNKLARIANGANKTIVDGSLSSTSTNPVQNKVIYTEFGKKLDKNGDSKDLTNTFVTQDSTNVTQWTDVDVLTSAEKHSSIFNKISTMFKNIRYFYKMLGTADISTLGDGADIGTVTGALSKLNSDFENCHDTSISLNDTSFPSRMSKYLCVITNDNIGHLVSITDIVKKTPIFMSDGYNLGNAVMSLGDVRFSITRISIDNNPHTSNRALCIEWSADGKDYKSYIDTNNEDYA